MRTARRFAQITACIPVLFLLVACGSTLGDILGSSGQDDRSDVRGTVSQVDTAARRVDLDVDYVNNLADRRGDSSIYYDDRTVVEFDGRTYAPADLERGDEIRATGVQTQGRYVAETITVTRNVRDSGSSGLPGDRDVEVRGLVVSVDTRDREVELDLDRGYDSGDRFVYFDDRTRIDYDGRTLAPASLQRGDEVRVFGARSQGRFIADTITVTRRDSGLPGGSVGDDARDIEVRGLVVAVDTRDRAVELDLDRGYDSRDRLVYYDDRTRVDFEGRAYAPENLERGDEVRVFGYRRDGRFWAEDIRVVRDVRNR